MSLTQMSISGGALILLIAAVRALALHRLPKSAFLVLWEIAALRLLLPFSFRMPFGIPAPAEYLTAAVLPAASAGTPDAAQAPYTVLTMVWLAGAALTAAYFLVCYVRARGRFRASCPDDSPAVRNWLRGCKLRRPLEVRVSGQTSSPLTYGVLRPVILLPKGMERSSDTALTYILTHEFVHIRRFDAAAKLVFAAVLCVHWFDPLVWVMYVLANRDLELSCDERVLDALGGREKASYALTLISMAEAQSGGFSTCNHFSKLAIEERIEAIMKYKKTSAAAAALAAVLTLGAATAFAAAPASSDQPLAAFLTGEDGSSIPASSSQVVRAARFSVDKDGNCTPDPDVELGALLDALEVPERQLNLDGDVVYKLIEKDQGDLDDDMLSFRPTRTEEEWQQIIDDIESGKIPPLEIPDDPNVTVSFVDYAGGDCAANG